MTDPDDVPLSFSSRFRVYSQASIVDNTVYISAQTGQDFRDQLSKDFFIQLQHTLKNLQTICEVGGGSLSQIVKLGIFLTDLSTVPMVENMLSHCFAASMPACTIVGVNALPLIDAWIAIDAIMVIA